MLCDMAFIQVCIGQNWREDVMERSAILLLLTIFLLVGSKLDLQEIFCSFVFSNAPSQTPLNLFLSSIAPCSSSTRYASQSSYRRNCDSGFQQLGRLPTDGAMTDHGRKWVREEFVTYAYILIYIALSSGQIFFNKWVLSSKEINFPYPLGLTLLHMVFSSVLCFILTKVLKIFKVEEGMTLDIYVSSVIPIGAMFAMTLWLGNTAYLYISVAFAQMLKAIMPVAVFILGVIAGLELMSYQMLLIMSVISFGVLVASYGEMEISWIGVVYQMGGVVGEALRLIFMEILVKRKGIKLNPISVMYYVSPCSALCLLIPWIFLEKPKMDEEGTWSFKPLILTLNSLCTFALNLSVFLVISHTSALTIRVAGVVKDWVVVLLSALLFADTKLTLINLFGYAIAIAGVAAYNNHKLKREVSSVESAQQSSSSNSIRDTST